MLFFQIKVGVSLPDDNACSVQRNSPWLKKTPATQSEKMKMGKYSEQFALAKQEYDRQMRQKREVIYVFMSWM